MLEKVCSREQIDTDTADGFTPIRKEIAASRSEAAISLFLIDQFYVWNQYVDIAVRSAWSAWAADADIVNFVVKVLGFQKRVGLLLT